MQCRIVSDGGKKNKKNRNTAGEKYLDLKFSSKPRHGKANRGASGM